MSLRPDDERRGGWTRSRSKSRERSTSRDARGSSSNAKAPSSSKDKDRDTRKPRFADDPVSEPKSKSVGFDTAEEPTYSVRTPSTVNPGLSSLTSSHKPPAVDADDEEDAPEDEPEPPPKPLSRASTFPEPSRVSRVQMPSFPAMPDMPEIPRSPTSTKSTPYPPTSGSAYPLDGSGGYAVMPAADYAVHQPYRYAAPPERVSYSAQPQYSKAPVSYSSLPHRQFSTSSVPHVVPTDTRAPPAPVRAMSYPYSTEVREAKPPRDDRKRESVDNTQKSVRVSTGGLDPQAPSTGLGPRTNRLSVSGDRPDVSTYGKPPASPLLEAYQGTYQSMPSPMMLPSEDIDDIPQLSPLAASDSTTTRSSSKSEPKAEPLKPEAKVETKSQKKRVKLYDAEGDADTLAAALGYSVARPGPLIDILPELTHDQLLALREEYKKKYKVQGRGVNIAKHIKMKTAGNFGKICFVTALGRWESESYWANFWYQSRSSSRELLIEALMGRPNADIREIKDSFRDKRYEDSLSRCMERELKADKFRTAVLLALEGKRQEETDAWPPEYRDKDVELLHRALTSREGGESAILNIVVKRSDNHLREVLRAYEQTYQANFARAALNKSNNLVGEVIAHILNGCINRPARDALLLRHGIEDLTSKNRSVELRYELLMSRLIRLHWDRLHLARVKVEYRKKYGQDLDEDLEESTKGEFGEFCLRLAET